MRYRFICLFSALLSIIFSCAKPIDEQLIQVAEDKFPPELIELFPENDSLYYSSVTVEGVVEDNSLMGGDGNGRLVSITYTLSNNYNRRGRIIINESGEVIKDENFGTGDIIYSPSTGQFSFTFSTVDFEKINSEGIKTIIPDPINGFISIFIDFEDANNNVVREQLNLRENEKPYLNLNEPGSSIVNYIADDILEIYGNVANSYQDLNLNNEILSLEWKLTMMPNWSQIIDLTTLTPLEDGHYEILSEESAIGNPLFCYYPNGISGSSLPGNPVQPGYFYSKFVAPQVTGNLSFRFTIMDKRGTELTESVEIASRILSPIFSNLRFSGDNVYFNDDPDQPRYFYSSDSTVLTPGGVILNGTLSDNGPVTTIYYKVKINDEWRDKRIGLNAAINTNDVFSFPIDIAELQVSPGSYSQVRIEASNGESIGYATKSIYDDFTKPELTINSFTSTNSNNNGYAKSGDTIILNFHVEDSDTGLKGKPVVTIANHEITSDNGLSDEGGGNWVAQYSMGSRFDPLSDTVLNNSFLPYTVLVLDNAINEQSAASSNNEIKYYEGSPQINAVISSTASPTGEMPYEWIRAGEEIILSYSVNRILKNNPVVIISDHSIGHETATSGFPGPAFVSRYTMLSSDDDKGGEGVNLSYSILVTDMADNTDTINGNTNIWFDCTAPLAPFSVGSEDLMGSFINNYTAAFDIDIDLSGSNAEAGDVVELFLNGDNSSFVYNHKLQSGEESFYSFNPVYSVDLGAEGNKSFTARVLDIAGNSGPQNSTPFTV
ncbi:MAG: hypothetical protein JEY91_17905, partial [Spirochaetaceae bacterium]|nr:hypothetical protein [Spirochaetaceae bacterium]